MVEQNCTSFDMSLDVGSESVLVIYDFMGSMATRNLDKRHIDLINETTDIIKSLYKNNDTA